MAATERRHARILRELDEQKKRSENSVAQGDEVFAFLEDERSRLRQQVNFRKKMFLNYWFSIFFDTIFVFKIFEEIQTECARKSS